MSENNERWLSALYRASSQEQPPASIDERILAAARSEPPRRGWPLLNWGVPLAAAAVVVLTVSLVVVLREEPGQTVDLGLSEPLQPAAPPPSAAGRENAAGDNVKRAETARVEERASTRSESPLSKQTTSDQPEHKTAAPRLTQRMADDPKGEPEAKAEAVTPAARSLSSPPSIPAHQAPLPPTETRESAVAKSASVPAAPAVEGVRPRSAERPVAEQRQSKAIEGDSSASRSSLGTATDSAKRLDSRRDAAVSPEQWLERIDKLRKEGRNAEAEKSLAEFRKHYPTFPVPENLK